MCYMLGSIAGFFSIGSTAYAIHISPDNLAYSVTTLLLMTSYLLKLPYYADKRLAFLVNGLMAFGWASALLYAIIAYITTDER